MGEGLAAAQALLPGVRLEPVARVGSGERTTVERLRATYPDGRTDRLVVKRYHTAGEGWVRETAALSVLPPAAGGPRLVAAGDAPPVVVTVDAGETSSVADALLGADPEAALGAVVDWATALARLHVATRELRPVFRRELAERQGDLPVADAPIAVGVEDATRVLDRECGALGVRVPASAFDELRELPRRLGHGPSALSPSDTCPDNNVRTPEGLVLLDFEDAQWRPVAWDVAYLKVPWPTCWCSWRMPQEVIDAGIAAYRATARECFPEVGEPAFDRDLTAAAMGWALISTALFIDNALGSDPVLNPSRPTPTRRAMILHRLGAAAVSGELPAVAELAGRLGAELRRRWGDVPLAFASAFGPDQ